MKYLLISLIALSACCSTKNKSKADSIDKNTDTAFVATIPAPATPAPTQVNKSPMPEATATKVVAPDSSAMPVCIKAMIEKYKKAPVQNPPINIYSYTYKGKTVYYVNAECCDNFNELYDSNCKLIGHPDGGFSGRGDGAVPDFNTATNKKLVWRDTRKL